MKTPNVTGSEKFLRWARHFFAGILTYFKEKWCSAAWKDPLSGCVGSFQIHPRAYWTESQPPLYLTSEAGIRHHWERNIPRWNPKTTSSPDAYLRSKKQTQRRRNTSGWCNWIQKDKHQKWMLVLLYPTHYVKMCSRCSILLSHSLLESAHSFSSVSTSAFIGKFFL